MNMKRVFKADWYETAKKTVLSHGFYSITRAFLSYILIRGLF